MKINGREIGPGHSPYIVAEISGNHAGSITHALSLITAAAEVGADAVKIQAYDADTITLDCDKPDFIIKDGPWKGRKLHELYTKAHTPLFWIPELFEHARKVGITLFASVFDETALAILEAQNCPAYKIASMEITDIPLIRSVASTKKPMIISTGMAYEGEIVEAIEAARPLRVALLQCVSGYPSCIDEANLTRLFEFADSVDVLGISDHTTGLEVPIAATAIGACIIEKHLSLNANIDSEDRTFSLLPHEFEDMVYTVRRTYAAMQPSVAKSEESSRQLRRSLYVTENMKAGDKFTRKNVRSIRPSYGLPPIMLDTILGKHASCNIERGTALAQSHISTAEWHEMWTKPLSHSNPDFKEIKS